jgi:hypothetical protein
MYNNLGMFSRPYGFDFGLLLRRHMELSSSQALIPPASPVQTAAPEPVVEPLVEPILQESEATAISSMPIPVEKVEGFIPSLVDVLAETETSSFVDLVDTIKPTAAPTTYIIDPKSDVITVMSDAADREIKKDQQVESTMPRAESTSEDAEFVERDAEKVLPAPTLTKKILSFIKGGA